MKIIVSHPNSNQFNRWALDGLLDKNMLQEFNTSVASFPGSFLDKLSNVKTFSEIKRRSFVSNLQPFTKCSPWLETGRIVSGKFGFQSLVKHETGIFSVDSVYRDIDFKTKSRLKKAKFNGAKGVYAYEDGALNTFLEAKKLGLTCFYDLPIGYWKHARKLLEKEHERSPEWVATLTGLQDSPKKMAKKDRELQLADKIFVASTFTKNSLIDFGGILSNVKVVPYGFPNPTTKRSYSNIKRRNKLKLLFVGRLEQRKGIGDVVKVADALKNHVSLTIVGQKPTQDCEALNSAVKRHHWISSIPHAKVLELMKEHDVLLFPSLFEGFGMVITEAMSQGTPVITTERTAGPDLIEHGENGWLMKAGSTVSLKNCVEEILENKEIIAQVGKNALESAFNRPWKKYGEELAQAMRDHF
ncbi:glycosyltransferase family 4 protein [Zunongwangia sp. HGR-M22]|uniref:glycosyltransferase family 4 protein n=1 Tax=Zunongwangia sp. HGR-M22 TaxID=3015168 RepID=UPI0022DD4873|nr:glycosyltransferase family 4 protein [Zunongwangia sp. HGR-M22]WBL26396.1 glycosyltransferase family 4 protein [Zunongwangia sp. HGR-M22]